MSAPPIAPATVTPSLNLKTKVGYGIGELGKEIPGSILVFFLLFFFTDVVGLSPGMAGGILLVGKVWDAINDPLVGWLSDRTHSRWGRRFPWIFGGAIPLGLSFWLLLSVPPLAGSGALFAYYSGVLMLFFAAITSVAIPHATLAAELTQTYNERTQLVSFKSAFSIGSSITGLVIAQIVFAAVEDVREQYRVLGAIVAIIVALAAFGCVWLTWQRYWQLQGEQIRQPQTASPSLVRQLVSVLRVRPFLCVMGIYFCSWIALQITAAILPYFVINWMGLPDVHFTQTILAIQGTALGMMFFWGAIGQRFGKRAVYCAGIPLMVVALNGFFWLEPGQVTWLYGLGVLAGTGLSTAYLVPWSMLPDVMDLDELHTGQRREGIFCGLMVQLQKLGTAIAIFIVGRVLEASGYISHGSTSDVALTQPEGALTVIRWLVGPIPALILVVGIGLAAQYPITRQVHDTILLNLRSQQDNRDSGEPTLR